MSTKFYDRGDTMDGFGFMELENWDTGNVFYSATRDHVKDAITLGQTILLSYIYVIPDYGEFYYQWIINDGDKKIDYGSGYELYIDRVIQ